MPHTPGPWDQILHGERDSRIGANTLLAIVYSTRFLDAENQKANALLIAAAPDLLEACKAAEVHMTDLPMRGIRKQLRAAIAKAEGAK